MSRALLRSVLELRTPITRLPPTFLLPIQARSFNSTTPIIEPQTIQDAPLHIKRPPLSGPSYPQMNTHLPQPPPPSTPPPIDDSIRALLPVLAAQPAHYITIHIHGRPYLVTEGDSVRLPFKMPGVQPGDVLRLNRASVLGSRDYTLKGAPFLDERLFECRATVTGTESEPMRIKIKKKRRNRRMRTVKSKHQYTMLSLSELKINDVEDIEG